MSQFAVVRHPEAGMGTAPESAMELLRQNGWVRVSEYGPEPGAFHLPDYAGAPDLDAKPAPEPKQAPAPAQSKESKA